MADRLRISTGAYWPYLCDTNLELQTALDIREYTDPQHAANVPHTLVLAPGLVIDKVYVGYWFWAGRPRISCGRTSRTSSAASSPTSIQQPTRPARRGPPRTRSARRR